MAPCSRCVKAGKASVAALILNRAAPVAVGWLFAALIIAGWGVNAGAACA
jgi:hypothetical protein